MTGSARRPPPSGRGPRRAAAASRAAPRRRSSPRHDDRDGQQLVVAEPGEQEAGDDRRARRAGAADAEHEAGAGRPGIGREAAGEGGVVADDRGVEEEHREERGDPPAPQRVAADAERGDRDRAEHSDGDGRPLDVPFLHQEAEQEAAGGAADVGPGQRAGGVGLAEAGIGDDLHGELQDEVEGDGVEHVAEGEQQRDRPQARIGEDVGDLRLGGRRRDLRQRRRSPAG